MEDIEIIFFYIFWEYSWFDSIVSLVVIMLVFFEFLFFYIYLLVW